MLVRLLKLSWWFYIHDKKQLHEVIYITSETPNRHTGSWGAWGSIRLPRTHFIQILCPWLHSLCSFSRTRWLIYHETNFFEIQCASTQKAKRPRTIKTMRTWLIKAARFERTSRLAGARRFAKITGGLTAVVMVENMSTTSVRLYVVEYCIDKSSNIYPTTSVD